MVRWFEREALLVKDAHPVDVSSLGIKDTNDETGEETPITVIPVKDITNKELLVVQSNPILEQYPGSYADIGSQKALAFSILLTHQRMFKANTNLGFTEIDMLSWGFTRTGRLSKIIADALADVQKKSESTQSQTSDNS